MRELKRHVKKWQFTRDTQKVQHVYRGKGETASSMSRKLSS